MHLPDSSVTISFSILCWCSRFFASSVEMPSFTVIKFSLVINSFIFWDISLAKRTSLFVNIPSSLSCVSTTGMPDISLFFIKSRASDNDALGDIVNGSITMPVSNFLTFDTFWACRAIGIFLCKIPIPPACATAIANLYSVTVSIAEESKGIPRVIFDVILVDVSTSVGSTDERAGLINTSSKERDFFILECSIAD